jgi:hypothetical protein
MKNQKEKEIFYNEYQYKSVEPGDVTYVPQLEDFIIERISRIHGIKRICDLGCGNGFVVRRFLFLGRVPWLWKSMICLAIKK